MSDLSRIPLQLFREDWQYPLSFADWMTVLGKDERGIDLLTAFRSIGASAPFFTSFEGIRKWPFGVDIEGLLRSDSASDQIDGLDYLFASDDTEPLHAELVAELPVAVIEAAMLWFIIEATHLDVEGCYKTSSSHLRHGSGKATLLPRRVLPSGSSTRKSLDLARAAEMPCLTIATKTISSRLVPFYEAALVSSAEPPEYAVIGIWLSLPFGVEVDGLGAVVVSENEEYQGYIV